MPETRFYHLQRLTLEQALPELLGRTLERGWRAVVKARSGERVEALNAHLWTFNDRVFLPHGSDKDGHAALQPVWLTAEEENPNGATVLFLTDGADSDAIPSYDLCCRLFDGNDEEALGLARSQWKTQKDAGHALTYWQQNDRGGWEKKAEANTEDAG